LLVLDAVFLLVVAVVIFFLFLGCPLLDMGQV
jgi:hypothetical protein